MASGNEYYTPRLMVADESVKVGMRMAGFLASVEGTMTVTDFGGNVVLDSFPLVKGFNRIPLIFAYPDGNVVALTTAAGTLLI